MNWKSPGGRATAVLSLAVFLVGVLGLLSWYARRTARAEIDWITHTYVVLETLDAITRHLEDVEIGSRSYYVTGDEKFLKRYGEQEKLQADVDLLRHLTIDNADQQQRLDRLEPELRKSVDYAGDLVAARRRSLHRSIDMEGFQKSNDLEGVVLGMIEEARRNEQRLLEERIDRFQSIRQWTSLLALSGTITGVLFLGLAGVTTRRHIMAREETLAELDLINESLEQRVQERTTELQQQTEEVASSRQALEDQTRMLKSVLTSIGEGLVAVDERGQIVLWNPAAERMLGRMNPDAPLSKWLPDYPVYLPDGKTPLPVEQLPLLRALRGISTEAEIVVGAPEQADRKWIEATAHPIKGDGGELRGGVVAFRDISKRKADEMEILRLNEDLEQRVINRTAQLEAANKELETFAYSVSHDLRAPLRHISGFTRIMVEEFGPSLPVEAQHHLERIEQGAHRMGLLVDELLNLTRVGRQSLSLHVSSLDSLVKDVLAILEPEMLGRLVQWKIAELPLVKCDPVLMRQVFQNLISNALKYSRQRSPAVIEIGLMEKEGEQVVFVRDNGVGFNMKYVNKLFGVFQRLHRAEEFEGTGVGLATVQRIIHKHGGRVWVEAEIDRGATFYFTLEAMAHSEAESAAAMAGGQV